MRPLPIRRSAPRLSECGPLKPLLPDELAGSHFAAVNGLLARRDDELGDSSFLGGNIFALFSSLSVGRRLHANIGIK